MEELIARIKERLDAGQFQSETAVREAIVLPILEKLGWDTSDPIFVHREYVLSGRRVDYALSSRPLGKEIFVEVKAIGKVLGADRQLFEYAFHEGIPFAVLTDGREWHFFLPGEQGSYDERRVHKLDLTKQDPRETASVFVKYLSFEGFKSGQAIESARADYRNISRRRIAASKLTDTWNQLLEKPDEQLVELVAERVKSLCGYQPVAIDVENFLIALAKRQFMFFSEPDRKMHAPPRTQPAKTNPATEPLSKSPSGNINRDYKVFGA